MVFHSMKRKFAKPQKVFTKIHEFVQKFKNGFEFTIEIEFCRNEKTTNNACINKYFYLLFK